MSNNISTTIQPSNDFATAADFARWEAWAATAPVGEVCHAIRDAHKAGAAMEGVNAVRAGRYADEAGTYRMILNRR